MSDSVIQTESVSERLRARSVDVSNHKLLLSTFTGSEQETDLTEAPNCRGVGRIHLFRRGNDERWPENPLPIDPALHALGLPHSNEIRSQVFQNAACNWRCWYCFVPFTHLSANEKFSKWCTPDELVDWYLEQNEPPKVIDLTGGQPDLVPEWIPWMMEEMSKRGLDKSVYLWSDDNLSGDYFWTKLSAKQRELIRTYPNYGRVACFKGYDEDSFCFNTLADRSEFPKQFERFRRLVEFGLDIYAYVTFTSPSRKNLERNIQRFMDRLQDIHPLLPLRTIPLEIQMYAPVVSRMRDETRTAMDVQYDAVSFWSTELKARFTKSAREAPVYDVQLR